PRHLHSFPTRRSSDLPGPRVIRVTDFLDKDDLVRLYRGADFFVAPYRGEGFGMKILDAFALGLPVLLPEYGGPVDYLVPGTYFRSEDTRLNSSHRTIS